VSSEGASAAAIACKIEAQRASMLLKAFSRIDLDKEENAARTLKWVC